MKMLAVFVFALFSLTYRLALAQTAAVVKAANISLKSPDAVNAVFTVFEDHKSYEELAKAQKVPQWMVQHCPGIIRRYGADEMRINRVARWLQNSGRFDVSGFQTIEIRTDSYEVPSISASAKNPEKHSIYAAPELAVFINELSQVVKDEITGSPLRVTSLTNDPDTNQLDHHCTHSSGYTFDIRPLPGERPTTWRAKNPELYDYQMNRKLILKLVNDPRVKRIYFNDQDLLQDSEILDVIAARANSPYPVEFSQMGSSRGTKRVIVRKGKRQVVRVSGGGHDNHIHIEIYMPEDIKALAEELLHHYDEVKVSLVNRRRVG